jgi:hypothetical protein
MKRITHAALAAAVLLAAAVVARADEASKPLGTWVRRGEDHKVTLDVKPDMVRCTVTAEGGYSISVDADYIVSKDGIMLGVIRTKGTEKKGDERELDKRLFYCRFAMDKNRLVISDLAIGGDKEKVKELVEGSYKKATGGHASARAYSSATTGQGGSPAATGAAAGAMIGRSAEPPACGGMPTSCQKSTPSGGVTGMTLPSGHYLQHPPQYIQPDAGSACPQTCPAATPERVHGGIQ